MTFTTDFESNCTALSSTSGIYHLISIAMFWPSQLWNQKPSEQINQLFWRCFPEVVSKTALFHIIYILGGKKNHWRDKFRLAVTSQHKTGQHSLRQYEMKKHDWRKEYVPYFISHRWPWDTVRPATLLSHAIHMHMHIIYGSENLKY